MTVKASCKIQHLRIKSLTISSKGVEDTDICSYQHTNQHCHPSSRTAGMKIVMSKKKKDDLMVFL